MLRRLPIRRDFAIRLTRSHRLYHAPEPYLGLKFKTMNLAGQTRSQPDTPNDDHLKPAEKKPRLDASNPPKKILTKRQQKKKKGKDLLPEPCSNEDVLWKDVVAVLSQDVVDQALEAESPRDSPFTFRQELEVKVVAMCSSGEALTIPLESEGTKPWVIIVPFTLPGEILRVRIYRNALLHSFADLLEVIAPNDELRDMSLVKCKYFGECAGCQYQMVSYDTQLDFKRTVVVKAYKHFSNLSPTSIPEIGPTIPSPLTYAYRTKITPHFEAPSKKRLAERPPPEEWLKIGFNKVGTRFAMDIEECPIATGVINEAYKPMREEIRKNIYNYKKGVSLILRDSLKIPSQDDDINTLSTTLEKHVCITDPRATVRERVGPHLFEYTANSFFQNNNSVLVPLTEYVRDAIFSPPSGAVKNKPTHLVDAYCGSGLFSIALSPYFTHISGIELSQESIKSANHNLSLNSLLPPPPPPPSPSSPPPSSRRIQFQAGDAGNIFASLGEFPRGETVVIIDPPRKGCDERFLEQLIRFGAGVVVYVSCNVHTQARDVGWILSKLVKGREGEGERRYVVESVRGLDLFPQTAHVESVAVLRLVEG